MRISCYILDDEISAIKGLCRIIDKAPVLEVVGSSTDPQQALKYLKDNEVDVVFLDINMERITGLEFIQMISNKVIFTTAHKSHVHEALEFANTIDYLVKPVKFDRFTSALKKIETVFPGNSRHPGKSDTEGYPMKTNIGIENIAFDRIDYIKASGYFSTVHYDNGTGVINMPLNNIEAVFPKELFARVHRSYIVNRKKISRTKYESVVISDDLELPMGKAYKENLVKK